MNTKKLILIILFILAVFLIAYGLYAVFWKKPTVPPLAVTPPVNVAPGVLPIAPIGAPPGVMPTVPSTAISLPKASPVARGGLTQAPALTATAAANPTLNGDGRNLNFYDQTDGRFYRLTPDGQMALLSSQTFYNVQNITWSAQGDKAILEYPDQSKILYNFTTQKQATLPKHWEDFDFSKQGDQIAAKSLGVAPENRWLVIAEADGGNAKLIEPLGNNADRVLVSWSPSGGVIAFSATGEALGFGRQQIIPLGKNNENYKPLVIEGFNFEPKWSIAGDKLIYSTYNPDSDYKPTLWLTNAQGEQMGAGRRRLNVDTWADKCAFADNDTVYCAVPNELPRGAGFSREVANEIPDTLYKIDLKSGLKSVAAVPENNYSMQNLIVSADKSILYFTDKASGQVHKIQLK